MFQKLNNMLKQQIKKLQITLENSQRTMNIKTEHGKTWDTAKAVLRKNQ